MTLRRFITDDSEILSRKESGLCSKCQRRVAKTIKRARNFGILPHLGQYEVYETVPGRDTEYYFHAKSKNAEIESDVQVDETAVFSNSVQFK